MSDPIRIQKPACVQDLPRVALVEASAGTGKTYAIERMVVQFLLEENVPIQKILVVTFTRKASAEMRQKIYATLVALRDAVRSDAGAADPAWVLTDDARARLSQAVADFDQAPISTIHSFCQTVLEEQLILTGGVRDRAAPEPEALFHDAFTACLRKAPVLPGAPREVLEQWMLLDNSIQRLEELLRATATSLDDLSAPLARVRPSISVDALATARAQLLEVFQGPVPSSEADLINDKATTKKKELLASFAAVQALCSDASLSTLTPLAFQLRFLDALRRNGLLEAELFYDSSRTQGLTRALLAACRRLFLAAPTEEAVVAQVFLAPVVEAFERERLRCGARNQDQLLKDTRRALREDVSGALRAQLQGRYRVALVDEFQDTDEVQWEILRRVFVEGGKTTSFIAVGDPKQAIYAFRGGDFDTFCAARARLHAGDGHPVPTGPGALPPTRPNLVLTQNRRSTTSMVRAYNMLLRATPRDSSETFFREDVSGIRYGDAEEVRAAGDVGELVDPSAGGISAPLGIFRLHAENIEGPRIILRSAIVHEARRLIMAGATITGGKCKGPLEPRHLMVLVKTNWEARQYVEDLQRAGVRGEQYRADGLFQSPEADDVLEVLEALDEPERPVSRVKAMRSLFFDVPFDELEQVHVMHTTDLRLQEWRGWVRAAQKRDWVGLFAQMRRAAHLARRLSFSADGERSLLAVHALLDALHRMARERCPDLTALLRAFRERRAGGHRGEGSDDDIFPSSEESNAVRVLTVFKAKGLEAPVVFLAMLGNPSSQGPELSVFHEDVPGGFRQRVLWLGSTMGTPAGALVRQEADLEGRRVQYVALTRAQYKMWLPLWTSTTKSGDVIPAPKSGLYMSATNERLFALVNDPGFSSLCEVRQEPHPTVTTPAPLPVPTQAPPERTVVQPPPADVRKAARGLLMGSFTSLGLRFGPTPAPSAAAKVTPQQMPRGAAAGSLLHAFLEHAPLHTVKPGQSLDEWLAHEAVAAFVQARARFIPASWKDPAQTRDLLRMVHAGLHLPISLGDGGAPIRLGALPLSREVDFQLPWPDGHGPPPASGRWSIEHGFLTGSMDFVFEHAGRVSFGDWKSNALEDYGSANIQVTVKSVYEAQVRIYTLALCRAYGFTTPQAYDEGFGGALYLFLRGFDGSGAGVGLLRPTWQELRELEQTLEHKASGRAPTPPTPEPLRMEVARKPDRDDDDTGGDEDGDASDATTGRILVGEQDDTEEAA